MATRRMPRSNRRGAIVLVVALLLPACTPSGLNEACDAVQIFAQNVGAIRTYAELMPYTARLSDQLYAAAQNASNASLRIDLRYAAGAARDVTTVIRNRRSRDVIEFEIDGLIYALDQLRYYYQC